MKAYKIVRRCAFLGLAILATSNSSYCAVYGDVNSDGLEDRINHAPTFYTPTIASYSGCSYPYNQYWHPFSTTFWTGEYAYNINIAFDSTPYVPFFCLGMTYVDVAVQFTAEPDSTYQLFRQWGTYSTTEIASSHKIWETSTGGPKYVGLGNFPLPAAQQSHYWLVKLEEPLLDLSDLIGGYTTPYTSGNPVADFYSNYSLSWTPSELPISGPSVQAAADAIFSRLEQLMGRSLEEDEKYRIKTFGCGDVARTIMRQKTGLYIHYPRSTYPERDPSWDSHAFAHYSEAKSFGCTGDTHEVYMIIQGSWKNGVAPTPAANGEVPLDSVVPSNYIVRMPSPNDNKWFNVDHGVGAGNTPQVGYVFDDPPPENFPDVAEIFVKVCARNE